MFKKIAGVLASVAVVASIALTSAPAASAVDYLDAGDLTIACRQQHGDSSWTANLSYPSQGGFGWRCIQWPGTGVSGVNIENHCWSTYGLHARGGSTAYNWYCGA